MKLFFQSALAVVLLIATTNLFAQNGNNSANTPTIVSEFVFQNPTLVSGTDGKDGAIYKFSNVANGIDATVKIVGRSSSSVILDNIDVSNTGWNKAFQPQLGIAGNVPANQTWWMDFEMRFYKAGTSSKLTVNNFTATALDIDGDDFTIQEFLQMNNIASVAYSPVSYLTEKTPFNMTINYQPNDDANDKVGITKLVQGPVQNSPNIDTSATGVMAMFNFLNKDMITFRYGAKSGNGISNAGERLNSIWFKSFSLATARTLPVKMQVFTAMLDKKDVVLNWSTSMEEAFSHFEIERSTDGMNFSTIAVVMSRGTVLGKDTYYAYTDKAVNSSNGLLFYRIKLVENSNDASYSQVKVIHLQNLDEGTKVVINTYPNPVLNQLNITLPNAWQGKQVVMELYSMQGAKIQSRQVEAASQTEMLNTSSLTKGFYLLKASCNGQTTEQKIIKD